VRSDVERIPFVLNHPRVVVAGLVPAIHAFLCRNIERKTWVPATSAGMTTETRFNRIEMHSSLRLEASIDTLAA
jgi:hypothetical protein